MTDKRVSDKLADFRSHLIDTGVVTQMDENDQRLADLITEVVALVEWDEMLRAGAQELIKLVDTLVSGDVDNPLKVGMQAQKVKNYVNKTIYRNVSRAGLMIAGLETS